MDYKCDKCSRIVKSKSNIPLEQGNNQDRCYGQFYPAESYLYEVELDANEDEGR